MVKDAEAHATEDKRKRDFVEAKNQAEALVHATEKQLADNASNAAVTAVKGDVESAIANVKDALGSDDAEKIKAATNALAQVSMKIGEAIYSASAGAGGDAGDGTSASEPADDNVVDADFEEVKDDKKKAG
jgi:molecular chaperone DnaK